ncbi:MAG: Nif3-like dinuclear metal center hexameric protein, partial [Planctomycetales bacterium]|nr:Nif3-like dinuclear metal center hexameric protein [Planctomycetales bacterium]
MPQCGPYNSRTGTTTNMKLAAICEFLESLAPTATAEDWDNVGLLVGQPDADVT